MIYVGIDNGVSGGVCVLSASHGQVIAYDKLPIKRGRNANEIDIAALSKWIHKATDGMYHGAAFLLEEPGGSKSAKAATSMAGSFHAIRAYFELKLLKYERITPQSWQKAMIPGAKTGTTKVRALAKASELWPAEDFILKGCRKAHDGVIDAALIAEFGRRQRL